MESDPPVARLLRRQLEEAGHVVVGAVATKGEAVERAGELRPEVVLMADALDDDATRPMGERPAVPVIHLIDAASRSNQTLARDPLSYVVRPTTARELSLVVEVAAHRGRANPAAADRSGCWKQRWRASATA